MSEKEPQEGQFSNEEEGEIQKQGGEKPEGPAVADRPKTWDELMGDRLGNAFVEGLERDRRQGTKPRRRRPPGIISGGGKAI